MVVGTRGFRHKTSDAFEAQYLRRRVLVSVWKYVSVALARSYGEVGQRRSQVHPCGVPDPPARPSILFEKNRLAVIG